MTLAITAAALAVFCASPSHAEPASDGTLVCTTACESRSETAQYTIDIQFPADYAELQAVTDYVTQRRTDFIDWVRGSSPSPMPYELSIDGTTSRSGASGSGTQSLVLTVYSDTGVHPVTTFSAFNYDEATDTAITFGTLFKPDSAPLEILNPIIMGQLADRDIHLTEPLDADDYRSFSITDTEITFYFNQDGVIPHEFGPREVSVPRSDLAQILA